MLSGLYDQSGFVTDFFRNYPADKIDQMHQYYVDLQEREIKKKNVSFNLMALPGWIRIPFITSAVERGNCALWTTNGFVAAGIFQAATIFPKYIFVKMYTKAISSWGWHGMYAPEKNRQMPRCNIISYNQLCTEDATSAPNPVGWTTPFLISSANRNFRNLKKFAHCNVDLVPDVDEHGESCYKAEVTRVDPWVPTFLNIWKH